ncbi:MAG: hypothetical protein WCZ19_01935 [Acholeplasma sp.]
MRYIKAILYTVLMSILFLTGIVVVEGIVGAGQIDDLVETALSEDNYHFMLSGKYQSTEPIIETTSSNDDITISILGFETMSIIDDQAVYYLEFIVEATSGQLDTFSDVSFELTDAEFPIKFLKFLNRELYLVVSDANDTRLDINTMFPNQSTTLDKLVIKYEKESEEVILETPLNITWSDLVLESNMQAYLDANNQVYPLDNTQDIQLSVPVTLNTGQAVIITIVVEAILIIALTVYIYVIRPKRRLGKIKPSTHLQKDIEKLKETNTD